ncbi:hypothetical protein KAI92_01270 [Candidatus Parcubacteria bacterium]|nr:hypothetical protein [Candidatus Parcubacteria bacterium]
MALTIISILLIIISLLINFFTDKDNKRIIRHIFLFLGLLGCVITITDNYINEKDYKKLESKQSNSEIKLFSTKEELEKTKADLVTANTKIMSTNEELEKTKIDLIESSNKLSDMGISLGRTMQELNEVKTYEYISTLNFKGTDLDFFYASDPNKPMIPSGLPSILYDSYTMVEGGIKIKCDKSSLNKFKKAIDFNQNFPFSYYALAVCDKESGGNNWEGYAKEAFDILKITTKIEGHNPEHDRAFKILNEYNN